MPNSKTIYLHFSVYIFDVVQKNYKLSSNFIDFTLIPNNFYKFNVNTKAIISDFANSNKIIRQNISVDKIINNYLMNTRQDLLIGRYGKSDTGRSVLKYVARQTQNYATLWCDDIFYFIGSLSRICVGSAVPGRRATNLWSPEEDMEPRLKSTVINTGLMAWCFQRRKHRLTKYLELFAHHADIKLLSNYVI